MSMTSRQLLEYASLDALGLLDDEERRAFDEAFAASPPAVQAQVRREQQRFASTAEDLLPDVAPPPGLRFRVLSAVREAIAGVGAGLNGNTSASPALHAADNDASLVAQRSRSWWNSAALWRAACIGFATASVVLSVFFSAVYERNRDLSREFQAGMSQTAVMALGGSVAQVGVAERRESRVFEAMEGMLGLENAFARLDVDLDTGRASFWFRQFPVTNAEYRLVILQPSGETNDLATFVALGTSGLESVDVPVDNLDRLAIKGPVEDGGAERVIMRLAAAG
jgi:hypothetical protein